MKQEYINFMGAQPLLECQLKMGELLITESTWPRPSLSWAAHGFKLDLVQLRAYGILLLKDFCIFIFFCKKKKF